MYKVSVTTIEKFRRYMTNASSFDTEQDLLESIKGLFYGNDKTKFGSAFGKIIEEGDVLRKTVNGTPGYLVDGIFFNEALAAPAVEYRARHPHMVYEVPVSKIYKVGDMEVYVSGRTDGIEGAQTRDVKCKFRSPDFQEYHDSYQWRFYLDMLGLDVFYYDVFEIIGFNAFYGELNILQDISIIPYEPFYCKSYQGMSQDCSILLNQFFAYIEQRDLFQFLKTINIAK